MESPRAYLHRRFWLSAAALAGLLAATCGAGLAPPEAPSELSVRGPQESDPFVGVTLAWRDNAATEEYFVVERAPGETGPWEVALVEPSRRGAGTFAVVFDRSVAPQATYGYRVYACNSGGRSPYSNVVSVRVATEGGGDGVVGPPLEPPC